MAPPSGSRRPAALGERRPGRAPNRDERTRDAGRAARPAEEHLAQAEGRYRGLVGARDLERITAAGATFMSGPVSWSHLVQAV
jgi:hypothetical protein